MTARPEPVRNRRFRTRSRELEHQIEVLFDLDPNILTISLDDGGLSGLTGTTSGGSNGAPRQP